MRFGQIGRRYFFGWQVLIPTASVGGEKRRYSRGYIEAFQPSQAELRGAKRPIREAKKSQSAFTNLALSGYISGERRN